jgi:hypothetical protein
MVAAPGSATKNTAVYQVPYVARSVAGDPAHETGAGLALLELYLAPGGAVDWLHASGKRGNPHVFVPGPRRRTKGHGARSGRPAHRFARDGISPE